MKRTLSIILLCSFLFIAIFPLVSCGLREKAEKAATEKLIEKALGDKVDIDGDTVTIKGEDGEKITIGGSEWPDSELAKSVPKFTKGKVVTSAQEADSIVVLLEDVKVEDFEEYLKEIKKEFSQDVYESKTDEMVAYGANNGNQTVVSLKYASKEGTLSITVKKE